MRVLVAIPHFYKATADSAHAYSDGRFPDQRRHNIRSVFSAWRFAFGTHQSVLNIRDRRYERVESKVSELAIFAITTGGHHLLDDEFCRGCAINHVQIELDDARMMGFHAHKLFAEHARRFDLFVYSEDDLLPRDPAFLDKHVWFVETFGYRRLMLPNRYEWNMQGPAPKTFIDGDLVARLTDPWFESLPDQHFLEARPLSRPVTFERTRNPHSGFHVLTQAQLRYWMGLPHWGDHDTGFVSPLESTAALTMLKTFSVYKSFGSSMDFCEVEHLDKRYSAMGRRQGLV